MSKFTLRVSSKDRGQLSLHPLQAQKLGLVRQNMRLQFGSKSIPIFLSIRSSQNENELIISQNIFEKFPIPLCNRYELQIKDDILQVGPYVSFLTSYYQSDLDNYLCNLRDYLKYYEEIGGAVLAFALKGVQSSECVIEGYMYNPLTENWVKGVYPYPDAVFVRGHVNSKEWRDHYLEVKGDRTLFNDFYFNKWEMHQLLDSSKHFEGYLPATILAQDSDEFFSFLRQHSSVYLKPVHGTMGVSILKVSRSKAGISFRFRDGETNKNTMFTSVDEAAAFLKSVLKDEPYIAQQSIPLAVYQQRMMDFRLIVVKNGDGQWEYMGMIGRYGAKKSVVSNISAGGMAHKGEVALQKAFSLNKNEAKKLHQKMSVLAMKIATFFDQSGLHCGNLGIDLGVDRHQKIWIIEVQHYSPAHSIALDVGDEGMYQRILRNNMLYLRKLACYAEGRNKDENS
ncbi:YheC/D-like protein [Aneurinibacillus soli]|uniref:Endospore coat-associated protein YheD n=1 Tax=Aneurinibacillus soli TaxID=1500254 RepID=A0A0U5BCF5_9BACL|nr:YheC/YheD family protein [Aneurinibacillus soli]PYE61308.1 YheC/D-like protein [Aneurinibacillus soli]BAU27863.1 Endospore coat-associated protein YheD [Aneurinibacillus soli]